MKQDNKSTLKNQVTTENKSQDLTSKQTETESTNNNQTNVLKKSDKETSSIDSQKIVNNDKGKPRMKRGSKEYNELQEKRISVEKKLRKDIHSNIDKEKNIKKLEQLNQSAIKRRYKRGRTKLSFGDFKEDEKTEESRTKEDNKINKQEPVKNKLIEVDQKFEKDLKTNKENGSEMGLREKEKIGGSTSKKLEDLDLKKKKPEGQQNDTDSKTISDNDNQVRQYPGSSKGKTIMDPTRVGDGGLSERTVLNPQDSTNKVKQNKENKMQKQTQQENEKSQKTEKIKRNEHHKITKSGDNSKSEIEKIQTNKTATEDKIQEKEDTIIQNQDLNKTQDSKQQNSSKLGTIPQKHSILQDQTTNHADSESDPEKGNSICSSKPAEVFHYSVNCQGQIINKFKDNSEKFPKTSPLFVNFSKVPDKSYTNFQSFDNQTNEEVRSEDSSNDKTQNKESITDKNSTTNSETSSKKENEFSSKTSNKSQSRVSRNRKSKATGPPQFGSNKKKEYTTERKDNKDGSYTICKIYNKNSSRQECKLYKKRSNKSSLKDSQSKKPEGGKVLKERELDSKKEQKIRSILENHRSLQILESTASSKKQIFKNKIVTESKSIRSEKEQKNRQNLAIRKLQELQKLVNRRQNMVLEGGNWLEQEEKEIMKEKGQLGNLKRRKARDMRQLGRNGVNIQVIHKGKDKLKQILDFENAMNEERKEASSLMARQYSPPKKRTEKTNLGDIKTVKAASDNQQTYYKAAKGNRIMI